MKIAILHGPNLNLLGQRQPEVYGRMTLAEIDSQLKAVASELGVKVVSFQSNGEGMLVDWVQAQARTASGYLVNAGGYTHTSVALLDALLGTGHPYVEVHLSNLQAREHFRHRSLLAARAVGVVVGFGADSYLLGLRGLVQHLRRAS